MNYQNLSEAELTNRVGEDFFSTYDFYKRDNDIDFWVRPKNSFREPDMFGDMSLLWAEAKKNKRDIIDMFAQLILTIGKLRIYNRYLPPAFLGVFDAEKIAFVPYEKVQHLFYQNDFNWNVTPSNHATKEFAGRIQPINAPQ